MDINIRRLVDIDISHLDPATVLFIDQVREDCLNGKDQPREVILRMLEIDPASGEALYLRRASSEVTHIKTGNRGRIQGAIGLDFIPCTMNCEFCSMGAKWDLIDRPITYTDDEIVQMVREFLDEGVMGITLRTTEFFDVDRMIALLRKIRAEVPGGYPINLNMGELTVKQANALHDAGANSAYHNIRMREGVDTPFDPEVRGATMRAIKQSRLNGGGGCIEPLGGEHTNEEIADQVLMLREMGCETASVMKRVNVEGTPMESRPDLSDERLFLIAAAVRLANGHSDSGGCHPAYREMLYSGACSFVVEKGANPRDAEFNVDEWRGIDVATARAWLEEAGFHVDSPKSVATCGCC